MAAVQEMAQLGPALAVPLLEYALSVYHLHVDLLLQLRPDVVLTCLQTAHGAVLSDGLLDAALHAVLGYAPRVVHCEAQDLAGVWCDMQAVADALGVPDTGRQLVEEQRRQLGAAAAAARGRRGLRVACIQWPSPIMACGAWVPELIRVGGWPRPVACRRRGPCGAMPLHLLSPLLAHSQMTGSQDVCGSVDHAEVVSEEQLVAAQPDVVVWALCGLDLDKSSRAAAAAVRKLGSAFAGLPAARAGHVAVVDGAHVLSRPGPLLLQSLEALVEIMHGAPHGEAQPYGHEGKLWCWLHAAP